MFNYFDLLYHFHCNINCVVIIWACPSMCGTIPWICLDTTCIFCVRVPSPEACRRVAHYPPCPPMIQVCVASARSESHSLCVHWTMNKVCEITPHPGAVWRIVRCPWSPRHPGAVWWIVRCPWSPRRPGAVWRIARSPWGPRRPGAVSRIVRCPWGPRRPGAVSQIVRCPWGPGHPGAVSRFVGCTWGPGHARSVPDSSQVRPVEQRRQDPHVRLFIPKKIERKNEKLHTSTKCVLL